MTEHTFTASIGGRSVLVSLVGQLAIAFDGQHVYPALVCEREIWSQTIREYNAEYMRVRRARKRELAHG